MNTKERILITKGIDKVKQQKLEEAIELFDRVLEINPKNTEAWNNRGVALFQLGKGEEAIKCYDRALQIDPNFLEPLRNKGFVLRTLEKFDSALECYDRLIATEADPGDLRYKAFVLVGLGRLEEAVECLIEAAKIEPSNMIKEEIDVLKSMISRSDNADK